jgi:hypothetical protein
LGKLHGEPASAEVASELLSEQYFDIRLIIDDEMSRFTRVLPT